MMQTPAPQPLFPNLLNLFGTSRPASAPPDAGCHPLLSLLQARVDDRHTYRSALETDRCIRVIQQYNPSWLLSRVQIVLTNTDIRNVAAAMGEIRAYGELLSIWPEHITPQVRGCDFLVDLAGTTIEIEVHSPQPIADVRHHFTREGEHVSFSTSEVFPFGYPDRDGDNVQGDAVARLASLKQDEHQFSDLNLSVLWLDFHDPCTWPLVLGEQQFRSISCFRETFTSGAVWNAFYARQGDRVHDSLTVTGMSHPAYEMEFNGRFNQETKVDFAVFDTADFKCVFQNHRRSTVVPPRLWADFICLFAFRWELSWLDWPIAGTLEHRIEHERNVIAQLPDQLLLS